jgi:rare lipoprotein A
MARVLAVALLFPVFAARAEMHEPAGAQGLATEVAQSIEAELARGRASWYGHRFHGRRTSSGERFDMNEFTAAHPTLPFGTLVRVRNAINGREVVVRINDRLPRMRDRIIDLSKAAAAALGFVKAGVAPVVLIEH